MDGGGGGGGGGRVVLVGFTLWIQGFFFYVLMEIRVC